jgi:ATP-dependent RNA circularization protein (DNA/RNA ligase family)
MANRGKIQEGEYSRGEFKSIGRWWVSEKVDGTNIRVIYKDGTVKFGGKTDNAQIPTRLLDALNIIFPIEKFTAAFPNAKEVILYGEGYGGKIQYSKDAYNRQEGFILFDAKIDGWWLEPPKVLEIAEQMDIGVVPQLGILSTEEAVALVKANTMSHVDPSRVFEGVVCRSFPLMMFKNPPGEPIMWKLKVKDFK